MSLSTEQSEQDEQEARLRFRSTGLGHAYVTDTDPRESERPVYIHRLAGVAWGVIDSLADEAHVHHEVPDEWLDETDPRDSGVPWLNVEEALRAESPGNHADIHFDR